MTNNPTMTLAQIRDQRPCEDGWKTLMASLGGARTPLATQVSLGDIARSNGAADVWWCVRALDWSDATIRRRVVGVLLLTVRRAATHTTAKRVHACINAVQRWCDGDDSVDLKSAARAARAAAERAWKETSPAAADAAAEAAARAAHAAWAAAEAEGVVAAWVARAAWTTELEQQRADLIAAFPPHA